MRKTLPGKVYKNTNQYELYDDFKYDLFVDFGLQPIKLPCYGLSYGKSRPSKQDLLQNLGRFIAEHNLEDNINSITIPAVRIQRRSKYLSGDFTRKEFDIRV